MMTKYTRVEKKNEDMKQTISSRAKKREDYKKEWF